MITVTLMIYTYEAGLSRICNLQSRRGRGKEGGQEQGQGWGVIRSKLDTNLGPGFRPMAWASYPTTVSLVRHTTSNKSSINTVNGLKI